MPSDKIILSCIRVESSFHTFQIHNQHIIIVDHPKGQHHHQDIQTYYKPFTLYKSNSVPMMRSVGSMDFEDSKTDDIVMFEDDDDDVEDFITEVNVYLNSHQEPSEGKELESILKKSSCFEPKRVKFAMDKCEFGETELDSNNTKQELLSKISRLKEMLRESEGVIAVEQSKRKKKERILLKLAKELKKRNAQHELDREKIEELEEKKQYLEHHWVLAGKELDQEKILRQRFQTEQKEDFERVLREEKARSSALQTQNENQIEELKSSHAKRCEELGQEIVKANLEADRLYNQLMGLPRKTKLFTKPLSKNLPVKFFVLSLIFMILAALGRSVDLFSRDALCSPLLPGATLDRSNAGKLYQAPWWAPTPYKEASFRLVCGPSEKLPVSLQWLHDGVDQRLVITHGDKSVLKKSGLLKAEIYGGHIRTWTRKGQAEVHRFLWPRALTDME